jgi:hypothetical protein
MTVAIPFELTLFPFSSRPSFPCLASNLESPTSNFYSSSRSLRALFLSWRSFAASFCLFSTLSTLFFEKWGVFFFSDVSLHHRFVCFQQVVNSFFKGRRSSFFSCVSFARSLSLFSTSSVYIAKKRTNSKMPWLGNLRKPIEAGSSPGWGRRRVRNDTCGFFGSLIDRCQDYLALAWRWRRASKRTTPAATETFSDFTGPLVGNETTKSQRLRVSSCRPWPSPPKTIPTGEV